MKIKNILILILLSFLIPAWLFLFALPAGAQINPTVYYGLYVRGAADNMSLLYNTESLLHKRVAIHMWYQEWGDPNCPDFNSCSSTRFNSGLMDIDRNNGYIPMISWKPDELPDNDTSKWARYKLSNIYNGNFDTFINQWAVDAARWGHPFFLRFAFEMNDCNWFAWCDQVNGYADGDYIKAWRHVHDIFVQNGATNVTWIWSPMVIDPGRTLSQYYPGDNYVDWTAMDGYNWGTSQSWSHWTSFYNVFWLTYQEILRISPSKPIMIAEIGCVEVGGSKAAWITDMLTSQLPNNFTKIKAFVWFNATLDANNDWSIQSSTSSLNAFIQGVTSSFYATNTYSSIATNPIPPPSGISVTPTSTPTTSPFPSPTGTGCVTGSTIWNSNPFPGQSGNFSVEFDAIPLSNNMDGNTGLAFGSASTYTNLAAAVVFDQSGYILAKNGSVVQANTNIPYSANSNYHFKLDINFPSRTYTPRVMLPDSSVYTTIGTNYAFRSDWTGGIALNNWVVYSEVGSHQVCNFTLTIPFPGDLNGDGLVNASDVKILLPNYFLTGLPGFISSDLLRDGKINMLDYGVVFTNFSR